MKKPPFRAVFLQLMKDRFSTLKGADIAKNVLQNLAGTVCILTNPTGSMS